VKSKAYAKAKAVVVSSGKGKAFAAAEVRRSNLHTQADVNLEMVPRAGSSVILQLHSFCLTGFA
jgi:hypothetical protein